MEKEKEKPKTQFTVKEKFERLEKINPAIRKLAKEFDLNIML